MVLTGHVNLDILRSVFKLSWIEYSYFVFSVENSKMSVKALGEY